MQIWAGRRLCQFLVCPGIADAAGKAFAAGKSSESYRGNPRRRCTAGNFDGNCMRPADGTAESANCISGENRE